MASNAFLIFTFTIFAKKMPFGLLIFVIYGRLAMHSKLRGLRIAS